MIIAFQCFIQTRESKCILFSTLKIGCFPSHGVVIEWGRREILLGGACVLNFSAGCRDWFLGSLPLRVSVHRVTPVWSGGPRRILHAVVFHT